MKGMPDDLRTLADLAAHLRAGCTRTARRALARAMAADPELRVTRRGRTILFTAEQTVRNRRDRIYRDLRRALGLEPVR
jgi:hypothetical protein